MGLLKAAGIVLLLLALAALVCAAFSWSRWY
jgi:hypothetical protein